MGSVATLSHRQRTLGLLSDKETIEKKKKKKKKNFCMMSKTTLFLLAFCVIAMAVVAGRPGGVSGVSEETVMMPWSHLNKRSAGIGTRNRPGKPCAIYGGYMAIYGESEIC